MLNLALRLGAPLLNGILVVFLYAIPSGIQAREAWTSIDVEQVPAGSPVWLRLRVDTAALEAAVAAKWFLINRGDNLQTLPDGTRLRVSELELLHPTGTAEVTGRTWKWIHQGKAQLTFGYRDSRGTTGTLDAWLDAGAIDSVFVLREIAPLPSHSDPKSGTVAARNSGAKALFLVVGPIAGGMAGLMYGKLKGNGAGSQPGMEAYTYSLAGMAIGLWLGVQAALSD